MSVLPAATVVVVDVAPADIGELVELAGRSGDGAPRCPGGTTANVIARRSWLNRNLAMSAPV